MDAKLTDFTYLQNQIAQAGTSELLAEFAQFSPDELLRKIVKLLTLAAQISATKPSRSEYWY